MERDIERYPSFMEAFIVWVKVAIFSFGGPASQIAIMHRLIVEEKKWIGEKRFLHALNYCMLLPGPEAHQLAIYLGWLLHRVRGGLVAGTLFVLPGFLSILVLSILYVKYQSTPFIDTLFYGIKPAVIAIVLHALLQMSQKTLKTRTNIIIAITAFVGIFFFNTPFPLIIFAAGLCGFLIGHFDTRLLGITRSTLADETDLVMDNPHISSGKMLQTFATIAIWLCIWLIPVFALFFIFGTANIFSQEALFFSKTAVITFGGAYSVLTYIAQQAVQHYGWLKPGEMLDGLGMAETTPGPLIQVVQFIGFIAAYRYSGNFDPFYAGILGSCISTWTTFVPSFLWIFAGAPYIEKLRKIVALNAAMTAITAAVVGVILNLSLWFAIHTLHDVGALMIMLYAILMVFYFKKGLFYVFSSSVIIGFAMRWFLNGA